MTAPTERPGGLDANARGIAVLVAAVLIGLLLLWKAGDGGSPTTQVTTDPVTSTTVDTSGLNDDPAGTTSTSAPTETTQPAKTPDEVTVVVLNGGGVVGAAGSVSDTIGAAGYQMGAAKNATDSPNVEATIVYYADGFQAEAGAVASVIGRDTSVVQSLPVDDSPGPGADTANVVVVLGKDAPPADGSTDTTTTAPG